MENNKRYIDQNAVTIITEINSTDALEKLRTLLTEIGKQDQKIFPFEKVTTLHFLRWFLIEDAKPSGPDNKFDYTNPFPKSLAFTSNFDGSIEEHLQEILNVAKPQIIQIYSNCKGFPPGDAPSDALIIAFFKSHSHKNQLFWPGIRGGTVQQLMGESLLRTEIEKFIDLSIKKGDLTGKTPGQIKEAVVNFVRNDNRLSWALTPRAKPTFAWHLNYYGILAGKLIFLIPVAVLLLIWYLLSGIFNRYDNRTRTDISRTQDFDALLKNEDRDFMNQFTVYGAIKRPYWYRRTQLQMGLWLFALNGKYRSTKGKLSGMETIHFARWCIFNNGKNVMFLSNFDGAWEMYLSEFIDRSAPAMNLTFGTTVGYPKVKGLFGGGAHDEQAFKTVVRNNQYPCLVWYSAYPTLTVKNIRNNQQIRAGLAGTSKESVTEWLKRI